MAFGLFEKKYKLDLWRIKDQVASDGDAILLADKDVLPMRLMYLTDDVMDGGTLQIVKILEKYGYQELDLKTFDGYIITGEVKGRYLIADKLFDFKKINGLN
jgi:hypothetical protein